MTSGVLLQRLEPRTHLAGEVVAVVVAMEREKRQKN
jgi:hypothetical protein